MLLLPTNKKMLFSTVLVSRISVVEKALKCLHQMMKYENTDRKFLILFSEQLVPLLNQPNHWAQV